jgi:sulfur carrier protein ThiS
MTILLINNDGAGFADYVEIAEGTTVEQLFAEKIPNGKPCDYLIRVNRQPVPATQVLKEGDRVSFTPTKIEGASYLLPPCPRSSQGAPHESTE